MEVDAPRFDDCILQEILSRLPAKPLGRFKCVSKRWHNLISSPHFITTQATRSLNNTPGFLKVTVRCCLNRPVYIPLDGNGDPTNHPDTTLGLSGCPSIYILAASNGLLFGYSRKEKYFLSNPTTKSFLPIPGHYNYTFKKWFGLAFDPSASVSSIKLVKCSNYNQCTKFDVYSPSMKDWRVAVATMECENTTPRLFYTANSVYVGGALHWLVERGDILAFDVETERAYTVRLPEGVEALDATGGHPDVWLGVVKGRMSIVKIKGNRINVWEMVEYNKSGKWEFKTRVAIPEEGDGGRCYRRNAPDFYDGDMCVMLTWRYLEDPAPESGLAVYRFGSGLWDQIRKLEPWSNGSRQFCPYISHMVGVN